MFGLRHAPITLSARTHGTIVHLVVEHAYLTNAVITRPQLFQNHPSLANHLLYQLLLLKRSRITWLICLQSQLMFGMTAEPLNQMAPKQTISQSTFFSYLII